MQLTKFLIIILLVTLLALLYVYQQSKIIHLAYQEQERLALLESLIDKNNNLRYNINRRMSLISMAEVWQDGDFQWPHREQLVSSSTVQQTPGDNKQTNPVGKITLAAGGTKTSNGGRETENIFTRLFGLKSQAEATPVKPR